MLLFGIAGVNVAITGVDVDVEVGMEDKVSLGLPLSVYILPLSSAVVGSIIVVIVFVLTGCYLRQLRKRGSRVGVARQHSHTHTE